MGNFSSHNEMDDYADRVLLEFMENEDYDYQRHLMNVLQHLMSREDTPKHSTMKMPTIQKRPDLTIFRNTNLYREIKHLSGLANHDRLPNDRWSLERILFNRENGIGSKLPGSITQNECRRIANMYIPNHKEVRLMTSESKVFCGTFDKTGSKLITASQDHVIRVFDSSKGTYHRINRLSARGVSLCILDIDFSPDGREFVYSTWSNYLHVAKVNGRSDDLQWLSLNPDHSTACIFSVRFSPCGDYIIGGANDGCIYVYERQLNRRTKKLKTNADEFIDINAVSFVDNSSNLFVSACDDGIIKLWDLRCLNDCPEPVGIFFGHFDGITYIDSKQDGRYLLSNSKDQSVKIWDLRRFSPKEKEPVVRNSVGYNWDYRWDSIPRKFYSPPKDMDGDSSVMTYRGHRVTKSLIRAKFSPLEQTGQRYIYTGCGTGRVIIYDVLTGQIIEAIEGHKDIVRDVAWHPVRSEIVSSSWDSHVNLNTYKRCDNPKRRYSDGRGDEEQPLRRSRRLALRETHDNDTNDDID